MLRLETVIGLPEPVAVMPPGFEVTVQPVIWSAPFAGSLKLTDASEAPAFAATIVGASGTAAGVTLLEGLEGAGSVPIAFVAVTDVPAALFGRARPGCRASSGLRRCSPAGVRWQGVGGSGGAGVRGGGRWRRPLAGRGRPLPVCAGRYRSAAADDDIIGAVL